MHGACAVKMWKRLVVCVGVCGYLVVVMVARGTMESAYVHPVEDETTNGKHQREAQGGNTIWIRQGESLVVTNVVTFPAEPRSWRRLKSSAVVSANTMGSKSGHLRKKWMHSVAEPDGFVSRNNSLRPLFSVVDFAKKAARKVKGKAYGDVVLIKRRYLSDNSLAESNVPTLSTNGVAMTRRQSLGSSLDPFNRARLLFLSRSKMSSPDQVSCDVSFAHRRTRRVCRGNQWAAECRARTLVCNPHLCQTSEEEDTVNPPPFLLVVIHSHPSHGHRRDAIRDTWGAIVRDYSRSLGERIVFVFVLGSSTSLDDSRAVAREVSLYRDIVQYELRDTYSNLTVKSVLALDWIRAFCHDVTYVLKTDDDAFMNISNLVEYLKASAAQSGVLLGSMHPKSAVQRTGQWRVGREIFSAKTYPPYCSGTAYVMTSDVARALYRAHYGATYRDAVLLPMEDVYITGLLPSRLHMACNHSDPFPNWTTGPSPRSVGQYLRGEVLGVHGLSPYGMYGMYKLVTQCATCRTNATTLHTWFALLTGAT